MRGLIPLGLPLLALGLPSFAAEAQSTNCSQKVTVFVREGNAGDRLGHFLAGLGDVDQDGVPDFVAGAPGMAPAGGVLVLSGRDGSLIYRIDGTADFPLGETGASAGDVNDDGIEDLILGSPDAGTFPLRWRAGGIRVYSGADASLLYEKVGQVPTGQLGRSVSGPGDFDRDGYDDFAAGMPGAQNSVFVYSGRNGELLRSHQPPNNVLIEFAYSMDRVGDINHDGIPELFLGAPRGHGPGIFSGGQTWLMNGLQFALLHDLNSTIPFARLGTSVAGAGDVNGDNTLDVISGGSGAGGHVIVYSGANGSVIYHKTGTAGRNYGASTEGPGDVNGDGRADFMVGAFGESGIGITPPGTAYVYSGATGEPLFELHGGSPFDELGRGLAGIGDVTGDGRPDFAIGSPRSDPHQKTDGGLVIVFSLPAPCLNLSATVVGNAVCAGDSVTIQTRVTNCSPLPTQVSLRGQTIPEFLLEPGEARDFSLNAGMPDCQGGSTIMSLTALAWQPPCADTARFMASFPVQCEDCLLPNCPRRAQFWEKQCENRGGGETDLTLEEIGDVAGCVDLRAQSFDWSTGAGGFCTVMSGPRPVTFRSAAEREFAALLANVCATYETDLADPIRLLQTTPISLGDFPDCGTLSCVLDSLDNLLLEARNRSTAEANVIYRTVSLVSTRLNGGQGVGGVCRRSDRDDVLASTPGFRITANPVGAGRPLEMEYSLAHGVLVDIRLFDVTGRLIRTLIHEDQPAGSHAISWRPESDGTRLPNGIYFMRCRLGNVSQTARVILVN